MLYEPTDDILRRIIAKIDIQDLGHTIMGQPSPCYIWTGGTSQQARGGPYARVSIYGVTTAVHLYLWKRFKGAIRKGYDIDHQCVNSLCIRLDHLQMVTSLQNQRLRAKRAKKTNDGYQCSLAV